MKNNIFSLNVNFKQEKLCNDFYFSGIKISENIFAFTSNSVDKNGEDKIIFFNIYNKKLIYEIKNYSFILSTNGLNLIKGEEIENNNNILLCACKKYIKGQNNGILLINIDKDNIFHIFYDTSNFEVFCFCQIAIIKKLNYFQNNYKYIYTKYFLVGGFNKDKKKGIIKLYKIIYNENIKNTTIEYIQDIEPKKNQKFKGFQYPISCIAQSQYNGNILISCWDGNIYLFTPPDIHYFLFYDKIFK